MGVPEPLGGTVAPHVGLLLLESLRDADTPENAVSHQHDLPLNLQRRLGLSSVVEEQIRRYARLRSRDTLAGEELASLFRLINRRPDARPIFREAGRRLAGRHLGDPGLRTRLRSHALPERARQRLALRRLRGIAREVNPAAAVSSSTGPPELWVEGSLPAHALSGPDGCALIEGAMNAVMRHYLREDELRVRHLECEGGAAARCVWRLEDRNGNDGSG